MKYILLILILAPLISFSQVDSGKVTVNNVVVKAKDLAFVLLFLDRTNKNEDIDSTIKRVYRLTSPADNADVTVNSIQRRIWRDVLNYLYNNLNAVQNNNYKRVHDAVLLIADSWLTDKINRDENVSKDLNDTMITNGKKLAKKEVD